MAARDKILALLQKRVSTPVPIAEIAAASGISEWARRVRELQDLGWRIEYVSALRAYRLVSNKRSARKIQSAAVTGKQRYRILHRDHSRCRRCGRTPEDGVKLMVDHIMPRAWGGTNDDSNLWTLCDECNLGKKAWQSDVDAKAMKLVLEESSGRSRLRAYFRLRPNQIVTKGELEIVAGITDYQRRIRELRQDEGMHIVSHLEDNGLRSGDYRFDP